LRRTWRIGRRQPCWPKLKKSYASTGTSYLQLGRINFGKRYYHCIYTPIIGCRYAGPGGNWVTKVTRQITPTADKISHALVTLTPNSRHPAKSQTAEAPDAKFSGTISWSHLFLGPISRSTDIPKLPAARIRNPARSPETPSWRLHPLQAPGRQNHQGCIPDSISSDSKQLWLENFWLSIPYSGDSTSSGQSEVRLAVGLTSPRTANLDLNGYRILMGPSLRDALNPQNLAAFSLINKAPTAMALSGESTPRSPDRQLIQPGCFEWLFWVIAVKYIERTAIPPPAPHMFIKGNLSTLPNMNSLIY